MTPAQLKLLAIRARINGDWDHPALMVFGESACFPNLERSILNILDTWVDESTCRRVEARECQR